MASATTQPGPAAAPLDDVQGRRGTVPARIALALGLGAVAVVPRGSVLYVLVLPAFWPLRVVVRK